MLLFIILLKLNAKTNVRYLTVIQERNRRAHLGGQRIVLVYAPVQAVQHTIQQITDI